MANDAVEIKFDDDAIDNNIKNMKKLIDNMDSGVMDTMFSSLLKVQNEAKQRAPYDTGTLRRSINIQIDSQGDTTIGLIGSNVPYARIHEYGGLTGKGYNTLIEPKFYLWKSFKAKEDEIKDDLEKLVKLKQVS